MALDTSMNYYTDANGEVWAFAADGSQDAFKPAGLTLVTIPQATAIVYPTLTQAQIESQYAAALTNSINAVAQSWQYDNIYTAATYLNSSVTQFAHEAAALVGWRDTAWNNAQTLLAQVQAGTATMPVSAAAFLALVLPTTPTRP